MLNVKLYNKSNALQKTNAMKYLKEYKNIINWKMDTTILDIGCGDGSLTSKIFKELIPTCKNMTGCDINEDMIRFANKHYASERLNFTTLDIEGVLPDQLRERFHHVISFYTLNWCLRQKTALQNIHNILRDQGSCFAILATKVSLFDAYRTLAKTEKWKSWVTDVERYISPYHDSQDSRKEMEQLLGKIRFTITKLEHKKIFHEYENLENLKGALMSVVPFKIPDELHDEFFADLSLEMQMFDTKKYNYKKSTNDFVFNVQMLILYVEKNNF
ncbi:juvenile hormone acid O-methyltransferase-like isoform X1 [Pieris rapae]|uniref:juvenile hormone acid O-methyltransferase-like isoform X1 n=1 Tax=Pieris rapae TaxID=64459 RepID=UPI001E27CF5A|nr:juvenile hormone acid O-methyltransferase-like isoform X1 [Pieris rapae]